MKINLICKHYLCVCVPLDICTYTNAYVQYVRMGDSVHEPEYISLCVCVCLRAFGCVR